MAEFEPVGVRAVVEGAEKFIADLSRMTTAVVQFYATAGRHRGVFQSMQGGAAGAQQQITTLATATNAATQATTRMGASTQTASSGVRGLAMMTGSAGQQVELLGQRLAFLSVRNIENANATNRAIASNAMLRNRLIGLIAKKDELIAVLSKEQAQLARLEAARNKERRGIEQSKKAVQALEKRNNKLVQSQLDLGASLARQRKKHEALVSKLTELTTATNKNREAIARKKEAIAASADKIQGYITKNERLQETINDVGREHVSTRVKMEQHAISAIEFGRDIQEAGERVTGLRHDIAEVDSSILTIKRLGQALAVLKTSFSLAAKGAKTFGRALLLPHTLMKSFGNVLLRASKRMDQTARGWFKMGNSIRFFGMSMTFLISLPILGFLGSLVKSAIDFEDAFAGVIKTVEGLVVPGTLNELNDAGLALQKNFRNMALEIPISAIELSKLGQVAGQLGVRGVGNITSFVDAVARIGAATDLSSEDAGRFLAQIIAIQGPLNDVQLKLAGVTEEEIANLSISDKFQVQIQAVGGTLVDLGNNLPTTEESIARFSQRIAASGKLANISTAEIFGIGAAFASVGIPAERGGTAVQKTFIKIIEAVQGGGTALKIFAKTADVSVEEFVSAFAEGSEKAGYTFERFVRGLGDNGDKAIAILDALGLNNQRVINSLLSVANAASTTGQENARLAESLDIANNSFRKFGDTLEDYNALQLESERRFATTANQIKLLKNQFTDLGITVGNIVLPTLRKLIDVVREVARRVEQLASTDGGAQLIKVAIAGALVLAVIGPLIVAFGLLLSAIGFIGLAIVKVVGFLGLIFSSTGLLAIPILGLIAALVGLAIAFTASFKKIDQISGEAAKGMIPAMWEFGKELILAFARGMAAAMGAVIQVLIAVGEILSHWLSPGSPPKIAPDLDKWGEEAMNTYLQGWLSGDFDVFNDITGKIESYLRSISRELGDGLIPKIIGSRKLIAEAVNEIKKLGKLTKNVIDKITKAAGTGAGFILDYVEALLEVKKASDLVKASQEELTRINKEYDESLKPLVGRLKQISDRQNEVASAQRIQELEQILADPRATSLVRELASLEIEQIGLEEQVDTMEEMRDSELEIAEIALEAAEAQLEAAEAQLRVAEEMLAFQVKNNQLVEEYLKTLENAEKSAKGLGDDLDGLLDGIDAELDDLGFEDLGEELFTGIDSAVAETIQKISDAFAGLVTELEDIFAPLGPMWDRLGDVWAPIFETILEKLKPLETAVGALKGAFDDTMASVKTLADDIIMFLVNIGAIDMPKSFMKDLEDAKAFEFVLEPIGGIGGPTFDADVQAWGTGLQDRAQEIREAMDSPLADLGTRLQEPFQKMKEAVLEVAAAIREILGGAWLFIQQLVDGVIIALIEMGIIEPFGKYIEQWEEIQALQESFAQQSVGGDKEPLALPWYQRLKEIIDDILDSKLFKLLTVPVLAPLKAFGDQLREKIWPAIQDLKGPFENLIQSVKDIFSAFNTEGGSNKLIEIFSFVRTVIGGGIFGFLSGLIRGAIGFIGGLINAVAALIDYIRNFIGFFLNLFGLIGGVWETIFGNAEEGKQKIMDSLQGMWDSIVGAWEAFDDLVVSIVTGLWDTLKGLFWGIVDTVLDTWDYFYDMLLGNSIIPDIVNGVIEWFTNLVTTVVTAVWDFILKIISFFVKLYTDIVTAIIQFVTDVVAAWTDLKTRVVEAITTFITDAETSFTDMITNIVTAILQFVTDVVTAWIDLKDRVVEAVTTFITNVVEAITTFKDTIKEKLLEMVGKALEWAGEIGQAIIDGLTGAITGGVKAVGDAIGGIAGGALDKAKSLFGIGSPSKEFELIGEQTLEGWIEGMQKQKAALEKIVASMVDAVIKTASKLFSGLEKLWKKGGAVIVNSTKDWLKAVLTVVIAWAKQMAADGNSSLFGKVFVSITRLLTDTVTDFVSILKRFYDVTLAATEVWAKEMALNDDRSLFGSVFDTIEVALENFWQDFMLVWDPFLLRVIDDTKMFADAMALDGEDSLWGSMFIAILDMFVAFEKVYVVAAKLFFVAVKKWADDLQKIFTDKKTHFRGAGENLINALAAGMQAAAGHLYNVARGIADQVSSIINDAYEITSPSKVFYKVGANIIEGWARGMMDNEGRLTGTMGALTDSVLALGGTSPAAQGVLGFGQSQASVLPAPVPAAGSITNAEVNMGGQTINNGLDTIRLQIALEQALRNVL